MANKINALLQSYLTKFGQLGIVVGDAEKTAEFYASKLGLGPWRINYIKGGNGEVNYVVAKCVIDKVDFKLVQSNVPGDIFSTQYEKWGNGIHHLCFCPDLPEKYDAVMNILHEHGYKILLQGEYEGGIKYSFHKTQHDFCCMMEIAYFPNGDTSLGEPDKVIEATCEPWMGNFGQVGFGCLNAQTTVRNWINVFNAAPWNYMIVPDPDEAYEPNPSWIPRGFMGLIDFEMIQPSNRYTTEEFHTGFIAERGQGPDHLCYYPATYEETKEACRRFKEEFKCKVILEVEYSFGTVCAYFDTTELMGYVTEIAYFPPGIEDTVRPFMVTSSGCVTTKRLGPMMKK